MIEPPMTRCHWCIAERGGNFRTLVDSIRGLAWADAMLASAAEGRSDFYEARKAHRTALDVTLTAKRPMRE